MKISRDEARRVAVLAHLEFDDAELDRLAAEMTGILGYVEKLPASVEDRQSCLSGQTGLSVLHAREDDVCASLEREVVERNAPSWDSGFFVVPKVIE